MNYIKQLNAFRNWIMLNQPSTGQIALWYSLMTINNMTGWQEWFTVSNQTLQIMTGLSRQGLEKARNQLVQKGLIDYRKGSSNQAGRYKVMYLYDELDCQKVGTQVGTAVGTVGAQQEAQQERFSSTLNKLKENKQKDISSSCSSNSDNDWKKIQNAWDNNIHPMTPLEMQNIEKWLEELPADVILLAIEEAIKSNVRTMRYVDGILVNWHRNGLTTKEAVLGYLRDREDEKKNKTQKQEVKAAKKAVGTEDDEPAWMKMVDWGDEDD